MGGQSQSMAANTPPGRRRRCTSLNVDVGSILLQVLMKEEAGGEVRRRSYTNGGIAST